jgi:hypothetical protein
LRIIIYLNSSLSNAQLGSQSGSPLPHQPASVSLRSGWYSWLAWQILTTIELIGRSDPVRIKFAPFDSKQDLCTTKLFMHTNFLDIHILSVNCAAVILSPNPFLTKHQQNLIFTRRQAQSFPLHLSFP